MNVMTYKGYAGRIKYSAEDHIFYGDVEGLQDKITFEGKSVDELEKDFHEAVDDYLAFCKKFGKNPEKTYKGSFNVRIPPELHKAAAIQATERNISLNQFVSEAIQKYIEH